MPVLTLAQITGTREWESKHGTMVDIGLLFWDETKAFVTTKPDTLAKRRAELEATIGVAGDWTLEDKGTWDDGSAKPKKVTDYPGKPAKGGPDGGGGKSWYNSEEGVRFTQERTDRRTALMQAVANGGGEPVKTETQMRVVMADAETMYAWLRQTADVPSPSAGSAGSSSSASASPSPAPADPPAALAAAGENAGTTPEGVDPPSGAGDCTHPLESRRQTASGRWRCGVCKLFIDPPGGEA